MADDVTFTLNADSTPPNGTVAATDETTSGPHSAGAQMGIAKLAVSANGDSTHLPATLADGLLVQVSNVAIPATLPTAGTATRTQVADNAADTLILAANASRSKFSVFNDSTATLYLAAGAAAATTSNYTVRVPPNSYYEDDFIQYTGEVRGIWDTDPGTGAARITEYT